ncbi:MAG: hypothetical protein HN601_13685, partial [Candidatus Marinimicrobia bacterium]|nr:hypothetical protein [Candidatus Neomarinimicrobiota bacterium]
MAIISAINNFELPYCNPDLDMYVDAYNCGDMSANTLCKLSTIYMLCYSWYGYLGRHINLRSCDYSSLQKMMPHVNVKGKYEREDKDDEFIKFLKKNDLGKIWNTFHWNVPPKIYEMIIKNYPINMEPLFCYRSPFSLFSNWVSGNRIDRGDYLSRRLQYESTNNLLNIDLLEQYSVTRNDNEMSVDKQTRKYTFHKFEYDKLAADAEEQEKLLQLINKNKKYAKYWAEKDMLYHFENIVSDPNKFANYLEKRLGVQFDNDILEDRIEFMDKRPLEKVIELDMQNIAQALDAIGCKKNIKE